VDLGQWLDERYRIASPAPENEDEPAPPARPETPEDS
jgi:endogenous inhibitor of DNA gyrase (YacG/DUF329 family)